MSQFTDENFEAIDMELVADTALENISPGMIVKGEIVTIDTDYAYVSVGAKSDGRISLSEFDTVPAVGDICEVKLVSKKLVDGVYVFSKKAAESEREWHNFVEYYNAGNSKVKGKVVSATNKGKIVRCLGVNVFLPYSLTADLKNITESDTEYDFLIKSVDFKKKSVVVSRKDLVEEELEHNWSSFIEKYTEGDVVQGEVMKFVEFGAFVKVAGIDALLHRNDMSWKKVFKQRKILKQGEIRDFKILLINRDDRKVSLGIKQLVEDPWLNVEKNYSPGTAVNGTVVTITPIGAFVELENEIEGFLSNSELSWTKNNADSKDYFEKGQQVKLVVLQLNKEDKKISLGYKQLLENPWNSIDSRFSVGSIHAKKIKKIVKFGMFVELEDGIDGLIHISDVSWDDDIKDLNSLYSEGNEVEFKILDISKKEMKISCGIKQLKKSPWEKIKEKYPPRTKVHGTISGLTDFGMFVKLEDDIEGLVHISEISRNRIDNLGDYFKVGDSVDAVVLDVDVNKKRLSLSIKHFEIMSEKEELNKILKKTSPNTVTLGDMINIDFGDKK